MGFSGAFLPATFSQHLWTYFFISKTPFCLVDSGFICIFMSTCEYTQISVFPSFSIALVTVLTMRARMEPGRYSSPGIEVPRTQYYLDWWFLRAYRTQTKSLPVTNRTFLQARYITLVHQSSVLRTSQMATLLSSFFCNSTFSLKSMQAYRLMGRVQEQRKLFSFWSYDCVMQIFKLELRTAVLGSALV